MIGNVGRFSGLGIALIAACFVLACGSDGGDGGEVEPAEPTDTLDSSPDLDNLSSLLGASPGFQGSGILDLGSLAWEELLPDIVTEVHTRTEHAYTHRHMVNK